MTLYCSMLAQSCCTLMTGSAAQGCASHCSCFILNLHVIKGQHKALLISCQKQKAPQDIKTSQEKTKEQIAEIPVLNSSQILPQCSSQPCLPQCSDAMYQHVKLCFPIADMKDSHKTPRAGYSSYRRSYTQCLHGSDPTGYTAGITRHTGTSKTPRDHAFGQLQLKNSWL